MKLTTRIIKSRLNQIFIYREGKKTLYYSHGSKIGNLRGYYLHIEGESRMKYAGGSMADACKAFNCPAIKSPN